MSRGFEVVSKFKNQQINLPARQTKHAAGYDFECAEDFVLPSIWKNNFLKGLKVIRANQDYDEELFLKANAELKPALIPTGIKAYMNENEYLMLANRSSNPLKKRMVLPNGVGIIDADYYNNDANEGEIFFQMINYGLRDVLIKKGERIGQGIFMSYLVADDEQPVETVREGGFGSTKR